MRRLTMLSLLTLAIALPLHAQQRSQSYFTFDDGGTIVRAAADDGRDVDVRVNMPVYPGDEVITNRRGRTEIRLSDGNVVALDRATDLRFRSILDSYDGNASQTIAELRYGHVIVQRTPYGREVVRLDTDNASYLASDQAIYAVESERGRDHVTVFSGDVEVRTPQRTARISEGEDANVDEGGLYRLTRDYDHADDFERWFLRRADRNGRNSSRYLDSSLAYADPELAENGSWVYVSGFNTWCWRPRVTLGWRPYFYGEWMRGLGGSLVWVSYEPWGWVPYHYGRWAYDSIFGWVWLPGSGYSPAWVYWMYGSGYIGWAPAGWWDCYGPYYSWAYRPYWNYPYDYYGGWYGHVPGRDIDYRPWTFVDPHHIVGQRVDRGSIPIDTVRDRLRRDPNGSVTITPNPARFSRNDLRDPANAVNGIVRRGGAGGGGTQVVDAAPFIRRDPNVSGNLRERLVRTQPQAPTTAGGVTTPSSGGLAPISRGGLAPIGGGSVAPIGGNDGRVSRGEPGVVRGGWDRSGSGNVDRGGSVDRGSNADRGGIIRRGGDSPADSGSRGGNGGTVDRGSVDRGSSAPAPPPPAPQSNPAPAPSTPPPSANPPSTWRERVERPSTGAQRQQTAEPRSDWRGRPVSGDSRSSGASDVPRRVIDRIGGARVYPNDGGGSRDTGSRYAPSPRDYTPRYSPPPSSSGGSRGSSSGGGGGSVNRGGGGGGGGGGSHSSGGSGGGGGSHSSGGSSGSSSSGGGSHSSSGSSGGGGHVQRN